MTAARKPKVPRGLGLRLWCRAWLRAQGLPVRCAGDMTAFVQFQIERAVSRPAARGRDGKGRK